MLLVFFELAGRAVQSSGAIRESRPESIEAFGTFMRLGEAATD
jgi:hypothetical protein